jgi:hypothetical protein
LLPAELARGVAVLPGLVVNGDCPWRPEEGAAEEGKEPAAIASAGGVNAFNSPTCPIGGFTGVLGQHDDNAAVFKRTFLPRLPAVLRGGTASLFCYGYTGAGKTHTVFGYQGEAGMYALAEATSYYNTATENELAAAVEVLLDGTSQVLLLPAAVFLFRALPAGKRCRTSAGIFLLAFAAQGLGLFAYNVLVDAPMYWKRYQADQAAGKQYLPFVAGLWDALVHRIPTQQLADWQADMSWMVGYFWGNPLAATLVAWAAPSIRPAAVCDDDEGGYEIVPLTTERGSETAPSVASARGSISMVAEE